MHPCSECASEYTSSWAAGQCAEQDMAEDQNTRGWYAKYNPHRKD
jgi:hypothetical protein